MLGGLPLVVFVAAAGFSARLAGSSRGLTRPARR
ncbi:hypothetical protein OG2516_05058 [Oceanicola granulosus HTCC2516]|uniref:Uncharacterized protein n=1 Tax=Oceanicola granulosus (strain ATCC BAA-861 / DSM 15982 / KCTC 12143 / HTCC2516) TaxID=314256 RepID=Q2CBX6_OCEGH|nr:hypothetical protein OG2516_05058 [Oceanicola granulosus HTCC2516]